MNKKAFFLIPVLSLLVISFVSPLPYGFYTLNRIITTFFSIIGTVLTWEKTRILSLVFIFVAVLFNPVIPIHLTRGLWQIIDIASITPFLILLIPAFQQTGKQKEQKEYI